VHAVRYGEALQDAACFGEESLALLGCVDLSETDLDVLHAGRRLAPGRQRVAVGNGDHKAHLDDLSQRRGLHPLLRLARGV